MTAETDLLPLPGLPNIGAGGQWSGWSDDDMRNYARACVSSATEALRRDRDDCLAAREHYAGLYGEQLGRAERLAEALREAADMLLADYPETAKRLRAALHPTAAQEAGND